MPFHYVVRNLAYGQWACVTYRKYLISTHCLVLDFVIVLIWRKKQIMKILITEFTKHVSYCGSKVL